MNNFYKNGSENKFLYYLVLLGNLCVKLGFIGD